MKKELTLISTDDRKITVDITDAACGEFGFFHGEIAFNPKKDLEVKIMGVAPGNDGEPRLWYVINHSKLMGLVCYWGGEKNLSKAGFILPQLEVTHLHPPEILKDHKYVRLLPYFIKRGGKFFAGTDNIPLFPSDLKHWCANGEVKELKSPILLKHKEILFIGGGRTDPTIYARWLTDKVQSFRSIGKYKDLIL